MAGFYGYARWRIHAAVLGLPAKLDKLGLEVKQTADSFSVSKSEQGRTIFTAKASRAIQLKDGGRVELHNVVITVYGREAQVLDRLERGRIVAQAGKAKISGSLTRGLQNGQRIRRSPGQAISRIRPAVQIIEHPDYEPDLNFKKAKAESDSQQQSLI